MPSVIAMAGAIVREIRRMLKSLQFNWDSPLFEVGLASLACAQIRELCPWFAWFPEKVMRRWRMRKNFVGDQNVRHATVRYALRPTQNLLDCGTRRSDPYHVPRRSKTPFDGQAGGSADTMRAAIIAGGWLSDQIEWMVAALHTLPYVWLLAFALLPALLLAVWGANLIRASN
jgi:hypothetical protein